MGHLGMSPASMMAPKQMVEIEQHRIKCKKQAICAGEGERGRNAQNLMISPPAPQLTYENQADSTENRNAETAQRDNV